MRYHLTVIDNEVTMLCQFDVDGIPYTVDITEEVMYYEDTRGYTADYAIQCLIADLTREIKSNPLSFNSETINEYKEVL